MTIVPLLNHVFDHVIKVMNDLHLVLDFIVTPPRILKYVRSLVNVSRVALGWGMHLWGLTNGDSVLYSPWIFYWAVFAFSGAILYNHLCIRNCIKPMAGIYIWSASAHTCHLGAKNKCSIASRVIKTPQDIYTAILAACGTEKAAL